MKITIVLEREIEAVSLRSAWLISRACRPGCDVAHLALDFGARRQRRDRIDDQHVDGARAHQRVGDLERLLAGVGLRNQEIVEIDAELAGIDRIERMFGVDEGADAALLLRLGDDMQRQRRLARGFRARRSRSPGRAAGRRRRARCRARASPSKSVSISTAFWFLPSRMIEPLPKARSICDRAASSALVLSTDVPSTRRRLAWLTAISFWHGLAGGRNADGRDIFEHRRAIIIVHGLFSQPSSFFCSCGGRVPRGKCAHKSPCHAAVKAVEISFSTSGVTTGVGV